MSYSFIYILVIADKEKKKTLLDYT